MKRLFFLSIIMFALVSFVAQGQTVVRESQVITQYGGTGDTLNLAGVATDSWYVKDFSTDAEVFWDIDSISGTPSVTLLFEGSYDNSNWISINSTTLTPAVGDTTFVQSSGTYLYPYLRSSATAVTNAQNIRYRRVIVIEKNQ